MAKPAFNGPVGHGPPDRLAEELIPQLFHMDIAPGDGDGLAVRGEAQPVVQGVQHVLAAELQGQGRTAGHLYDGPANALAGVRPLPEVVLARRAPAD